ncbi:MAG: superoxide dismutase [Firmicutes bacterium]|nr:superoxide dismutase [Bacillota bacterium]
MLNYEYNDLMPYISPRTLLIHYNNHYLKYKENLNKLVMTDDLVKLIKNIDKYDLRKRDEILYNVGGVLNHELYFSSMNHKNRMPTGKLKIAIDKKYGSYDKFKREFIRKANIMIGSGYTFLVINKNGLDIINLSNQETPYLYNMIPLLALDLWEHAYYLDYQSDRANYINNFFQIIDFDLSSKLYEEQTKE